MEQKSNLRLREFLPYRLSVLSNKVSSLIASAYRKTFNIRIPEWRTIAVLGETSELTSTQIAGWTAMDKVAVSRAVRALVEKKLVRRGASQVDGRLAPLSLTAKGRQVYNEIVPMAQDFEQRLYELLSHEERFWLDRLLTKLQHGVDEMEREKSEG